MKKILFILVALSFCACKGEKDPLEVRKAELEQENAAGMAVLNVARKHLAQKDYTSARDSIISLRKNHPHAIEARTLGLLTLDSIEMLAARDSLALATGEDIERLSIKAQFYERKLVKDKAEQ